MKNPFTSASERAAAEGERLQKVMARAGVASRRQCEVFIVEGRVKVNGRVVTELGTRVMPGRDRIEFDGRVVDPDAPVLRYYMLYKPTGYISSVKDPHGRPTVLDLVPSHERLYPVGRLDYDSEGLMLLTNDGALTHRLLHPRFQHEREYLVRVPGVVVDDVVNRLELGVMVGDPPVMAHARAEVMSRRWRWRDEPNPPDSTWLRMVLTEGHKREIRYMLLELGYEVQRLIRVRFDQLTLGDLQPGDGRWLEPKEAAALRSGVGLPAEPRPAKAPQAGRRPARRTGTGPRSGPRNSEVGSKRADRGSTTDDKRRSNVTRRGR